MDDIIVFANVPLFFTQLMRPPLNNKKDQKRPLRSTLFLRWLTVGVWLSLASLLGIMYVVGERYWLTNLLLYIPQVLWFVPFSFLLVAALLLHLRVLAMLQGIGLLLFFFST